MRDYCCMRIITPQVVYFCVCPFSVFTELLFGVYFWGHLKECILTHTLKGVYAQTVQPSLEGLRVFTFGAFNG